jgi:pyruvate kinase
LVQKQLIRKCNAVGKPVITATQMLESMIYNPRPTRAEASDVANAILDGTDAIMLSGETASGKYPLEAVKTMAEIAVRVEQELSQDEGSVMRGFNVPCSTTDAISHATVQIAHELKAAAIITPTESGYTPQMVSKYRPRVPIIAITPNIRCLRQLQLLWGVFPLYDRRYPNSDEMVDNGIRIAKEAHFIKYGDLVIVTAGLPIGTPGTTNMIRAQIAAQVILHGHGIGQQTISGPVTVIRGEKDLKQFKPGDVLALARIDEQTAPIAIQASALILEEEGLSFIATAFGVHLNLPIIFGARGALEILKTGMSITVDTARGLVYQGEISMHW